MNSYLGIIIARTGSTRLPRKVLMNFVGKKLIERICDQFEDILDRLIIATTEESQDDEICNFATTREIPFIRHTPSEDIAGRIVKCLLNHRCDYFFRINADSPFVDKLLYKRSLKILNSNNFDFITNIPERTYPYGISVEGFSSSLFINESIHFDKAQREHVTKYFYDNIKNFHCFKHRSDQVFDRNIRLVVDTKKDAKIIEKLCIELDQKSSPASYKDVVEAYHRIKLNIN